MAVKLTPSCLAQWSGSSLGKYTVKPHLGKYYVLAQFPYPSGSLHLGHARVYTLADCIARYKRMKGFAVMHPMGWDSFGLPAENAARARGVDPAAWTNSNIEQMKRQIAELDIDVEWRRHELSTSSSQYHRWTQWIFAEMFKRGLAYRKEAEVNWDPVDETVLANEQVSPAGHAWRSGARVTKRVLTQWYLKITSLSGELRDDLALLAQWPGSVKDMQRNWIGSMRDWLISRQRSWGTPIPVVHCPKCGPVLTIDDAGRKITSNELQCPRCLEDDCTPETDTMDTFVDSSWYFLRHLDPHNHERAFDGSQVQRWLPVDVYIGGVEHAVLHLLYARFVHKFLMGLLGLAAAVPEPFTSLLCPGLVLGKTYRHPESLEYLREGQYCISPETLDAHLVSDPSKRAVFGWEKMSKSRHNGVDPGRLVSEYGSDVLRLAVLFAAPIDNTLHWDEQQFLAGVDRWVRRLLEQSSPEVLVSCCQRDDSDLVAKYVSALDRDLSKFRPHTAIASLMKFSNQVQCRGGFNEHSLRAFAMLMHPFAPRLSAELCSRLALDAGSIAWPEALGASPCGDVSVRADDAVPGRPRAGPTSRPTTLASS